MVKNISVTAIYLLLLAVASYFAVGLFYQVVSADMDLALAPAAPPLASPRFSTPGAAQPLRDYRTITERNLFGTADPNKAQVVAPQPVDLAALEETELDVKLWGTLVLSDDGRSYAVIEDKKSGGQNLYQVGDKVQDALVKLILRERVVLDVAGKDEILQIEELAPTGASGGVQTARAMPEAPSPPEPVSREMNIDRKVIDEAMGNIGELMKQVRIRPFFERGNPAGLSLVGVAPGSIFQQMGIRNGDVLQAVDGQPIQTVDDVVNLYQSLSSADSVAIQVRRGGRVEDINYTID
ncbi:MAG TPA: PDZ domain-containing protein [Desulfobacteraceae bacterium]|nr:PDZ domain-containing protein [Desulfobacteraceae bacterium]